MKQYLQWPPEICIFPADKPLYSCGC